SAIVLFLICAVMFFKSPILETFEDIIEHLVEKSWLWKKSNPKYLNFITKHKGYSICEVYLSEDSDLIGKSIVESKLSSIEIKVLSIDQGHELINFPTPKYVFQEHDKLMVYGNTKNIRHTFH
ncbi:MAG: cation:proton antiporter regulatory subunit, partial [Romboutsia sp.]|uniref:cation:proton antiporter regulatory subunit n=1 Tax=Romboutsia sp. TaxID=1965302 RepID=UPI003F2ED381